MFNRKILQKNKKGMSIAVAYISIAAIFIAGSITLSWLIVHYVDDATHQSDRRDISNWYLRCFQFGDEYTTAAIVSLPDGITLDGTETSVTLELSASILESDWRADINRDGDINDNVDEIFLDYTGNLGLNVASTEVLAERMGLVDAGRGSPAMLTSAVTSGEVVVGVNSARTCWFFVST